MPARVVVLVVLAGAVLVAGVYLFHAVNQTPAVSAAVPARHADQPAVDESAQRRVPDHASTSTSTATPAAPPQIASTDPASDDDLDLGSGSANPKLAAVMDQANKAYDRGDYEEAKSIAGKVLAALPKNTRMLRIMVSAACMESDAAVAQKWYVELPRPDRLQMKARCDRSGVTFTEPPQ